MAKNEGGFAFPGEQGHVPDGTWNQTWTPGMTLRQFYKAAALMGMGGHPYNFFEYQYIANWCGKIADAMIAEDEEASK